MTQSRVVWTRYAVVLALIIPACIGQFTALLHAGQLSSQPDLRLQRLETLADLWGKLYLFHPYVVVRDRDWQKVLLDVIPHVEAARSADDFLAALNTHLFAPLGDPLAFVQRTPVAAATEKRRGTGAVRRLSSTVSYWDAADPYSFAKPAFLRKAITDLRSVTPGDTLGRRSPLALSPS